MINLPPEVLKDEISEFVDTYLIHCTSPHLPCIGTTEEAGVLDEDVVVEDRGSVDPSCLQSYLRRWTRSLVCDFVSI